LHLLIPFSQALALSFAAFLQCFIFYCNCLSQPTLQKMVVLSVFIYCPAIGKTMPSLVGKVCTALRFVCLVVFAKKSPPTFYLPLLPQIWQVVGSIFLA